VIQILGGKGLGLHRPAACSACASQGRQTIQTVVPNASFRPTRTCGMVIPSWRSE